MTPPVNMPMKIIISIIPTSSSISEVPAWPDGPGPVLIVVDAHQTVQVPAVGRATRRPGPFRVTVIAYFFLVAVADTWPLR